MRLRTRSLLRPRVGAVLALVDQAHQGQVAGVHDFRVAARSLRAGLRTLMGRTTASRVRRSRQALRDAVRCLADVRDRDVGRSLLARVSSSSEVDPALRRRIIGLSESDRRIALNRAVTDWPRNLDSLLIDLLKGDESSVETLLRRTRAEAWQQRRRALDVLDRLGRRSDPEGLHELRRRIRSLRYAIEILAEVESGAAVRGVRLKPLQGALGEAQDRIVLSRWLTAQAARLRGRDPALGLALRRQARRFRQESVSAHQAFLKLKPKSILGQLALHRDPFPIKT